MNQSLDRIVAGTTRKRPWWLFVCVAALSLLAPAMLALGAEVGTDDQRISDMAGIGTNVGRALDATAAYNSSAQEYLLVWSGTEGDVLTNQDRLYGQRINARTGLEVGSNDYLVSEIAGADPDLDAQAPKVVYNSVANEYFVVFVGNPNPATTETEAFGQRLSGADGSRIGSAFPISLCGSAGDVLADVGTNIDTAIDVAFNATDNQYLVVFRCDDVGDNGAVNSEFEIYGRLVNADGTVVGSNDVQISQIEGANGNSIYNAEAPAVAWNSDLNEYLVVFGGDTAATGDGNREIYGQRLSAAGAQIGTNDFAISDTLVATRDSSTAEVAYNPVTDQYLVVWGGDRLVDNQVQVHGQLLTASGTPTGTNDFLIGSKTDSTNPQVEVIYNSVDDEFLVSWTRGTADDQMVVQRIDANGTALGTDDQVVSSMAFSVQGPSGLAYNSRANSYLLAWAGSDDQAGQINGENEIFIQLLSEPVDMQITKSASPARPSPGGTVTYTLTYTNAGPNRITDAVITDSVSAQLTGVSCTVGAHTGSTPVLRPATTCTFDIDTLLSGQGGTITITGTVAGTINADGSVSGAPADGTVINNSANIASATPHLDTNAGNNTTPNAPVTVDYPPRVVSITRSSTNPTNAASVTWLVTFSEPVSGPADGNFSVVMGGGVSGASVTSVSGSGATRTVTASTGAGSGTLGLNLTSSAGITDVSAGKALVGTPPAGELYTIDKIPPDTTIITTPNNPSASGNATFTFTGIDTGGSGLASFQCQIDGSGFSSCTSPRSYTGLSDGSHTFQVRAIDAAGNVDPTPASFTWTIDTTPPDTTITTTPANPSNSANATFSFTGSDTGGSGIASFQCQIDGGGFSPCTSPQNYTGLSDGSHTFQVRAIDAAGNVDPTPASFTWTIDTIGPTVTINQAAGQADPTNSGPINFTVTFSEPVIGFTGADVSFAGSTVGGSLSAAVSGGPTSYTVAVSGMSGNGTVVASIPSAGAATDAAGNQSAPSTSTDNSVTFDTTGPTVTINQAAGQADPTNASPIVFDVVFSESVTGFTGADISFAGSTVGGSLSASVSGAGSTYTVSVTGMSGSGTVVASIASAGAATDLAGNQSAPSTSTDNSVTFDTTGPTVTINQGSGQADPTTDSPIVFDVVFSESVTGFTGTDVTLGGTAGATTAVVNGSGTTYTVSVSGMTSGGTVTASILASGASDGAGNGNTASTSTDNTVTFIFDITPPTVTIEQAAGQADPTNNSTINFTATFSEDVTGFEAADITIGGTAGATTVVVSGGPAVYNVAISGMANDGTVTASIPASAAEDLVGLPSAASTSTDNTVTYDATSPTVTIEQAAGQADPTNAGPILFTVTFSEAVAGFTDADVDLSGTAGATTASVSGGPTVYTVSVSGMANDGTVIAAIPVGAASDAAGNQSAASTSVDNEVTYDATAPAVTINQGSGQSDPTSGSPIVFDVVFSESVTGFTDADVVISGTAGATTAVVSGSGASYTVEISGMTSDGVVIASIGAGAASDAAGNPSAASTSTDNTVAFFSTPSDVTIEQAAGQADPTNASPILFEVVFTRPVTGFDGSDVLLSGTAGATTAVVSGSGTTYTVSVSGMTGDGTVIAAIPADAATDSFGKGNNASTSNDNTVLYDATAPTADIVDVTPDPRNTPVASISITFSEDVTGLDLGDLSLTRDASPVNLAGATLSGSGSSYTLDNLSGLTGADGSYVLTLTAAGSGIADAAGNPLAGNASDSWVNDSTAPVTTATVSGTQKAGCPADCFTTATVSLSRNEPGSTTYRINGGLWQTYSAPFVITTEGSNLVEFFSVDTLGNTETPIKSVTVKITTFPSTSVLETFNRANGALGNNWRGVEGLGGYSIVGNRVDVFGGGPIYWNGATFGTRQEAFITFVDLDEASNHQALLLKVQGNQNGTWQQRDMISVSYDAANQQIIVETHRVGRGWRTVASFSATLQDGDTLGARALNNGQIRVYINCALAGTATMATDDQAFFNPRGGRIGLWTINAANALLDNFGGGNVTP